MFSEINASENAKSFEGILREAIETRNRDIILFCKNHIYPKYKLELSEAFEEANKIIDEFFKNI